MTNTKKYFTPREEGKETGKIYSVTTTWVKGEQGRQRERGENAKKR